MPAGHVKHQAGNGTYLSRSFFSTHISEFTPSGRHFRKSVKTVSIAPPESHYMFWYRMPGQQQEEDLTDGADSAKKKIVRNKNQYCCYQLEIFGRYLGRPRLGNGE